MASPIKQYVLGSPANAVQVSRFQPFQGGLQENITERIQNLLGQNPSFEPIAQQARQQYQEQSLPALKNQFSTPGASSAYQNAVSRGASNLETNLAALQSNYNVEQQKQIPALGKLALEPQFETIYEPAESGALQDFISALTPTVGQQGGNILGQLAQKYLGLTGTDKKDDQTVVGAAGSQVAQQAGKTIGNKIVGAVTPAAAGAAGAAAVTPAAAGGAAAITPAATGATTGAAGAATTGAAATGIGAKIAPVVAKALPVAAAAALAYGGYRFVKWMTGKSKKEKQKYKAQKALYKSQIAKQKAAKKAAKATTQSPLASNAAPSTPVVKKSSAPKTTKPKQSCPGGVCPLKKKK